MFLCLVSIETVCIHVLTNFIYLVLLVYKQYSHILFSESIKAGNAFLHFTGKTPGGERLRFTHDNTESKLQV